MDKPFFDKTRIMLFFSVLLLGTASVLSYILPPETRSIIPFPGIVIPIINTLSALICLITLFFPSFPLPIYIVAFVQAVSTALTGYETLGIFLFSAFTTMLFCDGFFKKHTKRKIITLISIWALVLLGIIPFGLPRVVLAYSTSFFVLGFDIYISDKLSHFLSPLLPPGAVKEREGIPKVGSEISLTELGLTKRQAEIVLDYVTNGGSYKALADTFIISISTVKAEMSQAFKLFGVSNREDLRILLLQYKVNL